MATRDAVLTVTVDAADLERVLDAHTARMRELVASLLEQQDRSPFVGTGALVASLVVAGASRRVSRRELLGLTWFARRRGGGSKSLAVNCAADRAAGHGARVQQMNSRG